MDKSTSPQATSQNSTFKSQNSLTGDEIICIDHHPVYEKTEYRFTDIRPGVGACASIIAQYFFENEIPMDQRIATALTLMSLDSVVENDYIAVTADMPLGKLVNVISKSHSSFIPVLDSAGDSVGIADSFCGSI